MGGAPPGRETKGAVVAEGARRNGGQTVTGIERAIDVLNLFTREGVKDLGVTEVANELGLSKAVVHRVLVSFRNAELVELDEDTRRYRLGLSALRIGMAYLDGIDVIDVARDRLDRLVELTGETATVSVLSGQHRVYVAQATPQRDIKMVVRIGSAHLLHAGASSKAILAFMPQDFQDAYLARGELEQVTGRTIVSLVQLRAELEAIRERGYALSLGERQQGAGSVAAPVLDHSGRPIAALSVCGPVERFEAEAEGCAAHLLEVTRDISRRMGFAVV